MSKTEVLYAQRWRGTNDLVDWDDRPGPMSSGYPMRVSSLIEARLYKNLPQRSNGDDLEVVKLTVTYETEVVKQRPEDDPEWPTFQRLTKKFEGMK